MDFDYNWRLIGVVSGFVFLLSFIYNDIVRWLEDGGYAEGYTSFLVVGGVVVTLLGLACIDRAAAVLALILFSASGLPMVVGSMWRHARRRKADQDGMRKDAEA